MSLGARRRRILLTESDGRTLFIESSCSGFLIWAGLGTPLPAFKQIT